MTMTKSFQLVIPLRESTHESATNDSPFYSAREPRSLSNDSFQRPTSSLMDHQTELSSFQLSGFDSNRRKISDTNYSFVELPMTTQLSVFSASYSLTEKMLMKASNAMPFTHGRKTNYTMSDQSEDAPTKPIVAAIKSHAYSPENAKKLIHSPETTNAESRTMNVSNFDNNLQTMRNQSFGIGTKSFELSEPATAPFHEKGDKPLQSNEDMSYLVRTYPVAEVPWNTLATSGDETKPSSSQPSHLVDAEPNVAVVSMSNTLESDDALLHMMPVPITYGKTNRNSKLIEETKNNAPLTEFNESNVCNPASDHLDGSTVPVTTLNEHCYGKLAEKNPVAPLIQISPTSNAAQLLEEHWINIEGIPSTSKVTYSELTQLAQNQKKRYGRSNQIIVQSNELIKLPTTQEVGSVVQIHPNSVKRVVPNQIVLTPMTTKPGNGAIRIDPKSTRKKKGAIQKPLLKYALQNATIENSKNAATVPIALQSKLQLPIKNKGAIPSASQPKLQPKITQSKLQPPMRNVANSYATPATVTTMKRKNVEIISPVTPSKMQKLDKPVRVTMSDIAGVASIITLSGIDIQRVNVVRGVKRSVDIAGINLTSTSPRREQKDKSLAECFELLSQNNVSMFRVPSNKPSNNAMDRCMKVLEMNGVSVKRVRKR